MDSANTTTPLGRVIPVVLIILFLTGLYYLYQYLFGATTTGNIYTLLSKTRSAVFDQSTSITVTSDKLPPIYEGGEFTITTWIYVNNLSYRRGFNKPIITIGGHNSDIIRIYLGGDKPSLNIRLNTGGNSKLDNKEKASVFNEIQTGADILGGSQICDLPEVELQRWASISVVVNGKTVDVYYDGKLTRSCVLPSLYKVDAGGYSARLLEYGGFGGQISTTAVYDYALNPEQVYKTYMAGPEPTTDLLSWLASFIMPRISVSITPIS
jgi:Concanavalin A-like lectin/glucanases superfamily